MVYRAKQTGFTFIERAGDYCLALIGQMSADGHVGCHSPCISGPVGQTL